MNPLQMQKAALFDHRRCSCKHGDPAGAFLCTIL
jgi:hypothetical protein